jgi:peptidoglycan/LPS O-acetylase OafA/YrhL
MAGRFPRIDIRWSIPAIVLGYVAALKAPFVYGFSVASILPIVLVIGAFATADIRGERTGVNNKTWRWLGEISFGFYICQGVVIFYGRTLFGADPFSTPVAVLVAIALFIATLLAGWGLHALVERPMMRRFARPRVRVAEGRSGSTA